MTKMVLMATAFSKNSMMGMVIVALVCMGIPFIALAYMKTKTGAKITSFLKGLLFYALFAFGVSGLINILLLGGLSLSSVLNRSIHPVYYAVYGAVLAGIVEETGKFVGLKYMMKKTPDKQMLCFSASVTVDWKHSLMEVPFLWEILYWHCW